MDSSEDSSGFQSDTNPNNMSIPPSPRASCSLPNHQDTPSASALPSEDSSFPPPPPDPPPSFLFPHVGDTEGRTSCRPASWGKSHTTDLGEATQEKVHRFSRELSCSSFMPPWCLRRGYGTFPPGEGSGLPETILFKLVPPHISGVNTLHAGGAGGGGPAHKKRQHLHSRDVLDCCILLDFMFLDLRSYQERRKILRNFVLQPALGLSIQRDLRSRHGQGRNVQTQSSFSPLSLSPSEKRQRQEEEKTSSYAEGDPNIGLNSLGPSHGSPSDFSSGVSASQRTPSQLYVQRGLESCETEQAVRVPGEIPKVSDTAGEELKTRHTAEGQDAVVDGEENERGKEEEDRSGSLSTSVDLRESASEVEMNKRKTSAGLQNEEGEHQQQLGGNKEIPEGRGGRDIDSSREEESQVSGSNHSKKPEKKRDPGKPTSKSSGGGSSSSGLSAKGFGFQCFCVNTAGDTLVAACGNFLHIYHVPTKVLHASIRLPSPSTSASSASCCSSLLSSQHTYEKDRQPPEVHPLPPVKFLQFFDEDRLLLVATGCGHVYIYFMLQAPQPALLSYFNISEVYVHSMDRLPYLAGLPPLEKDDLPSFTASSPPQSPSQLNDTDRQTAHMGEGGEHTKESNSPSSFHHQGSHVFLTGIEPLEISYPPCIALGAQRCTDTWRIATALAESVEKEDEEKGRSKSFAFPRIISTPEDTSCYNPFFLDSLDNELSKQSLSPSLLLSSNACSVSSTTRRSRTGNPSPSFVSSTSQSSSPSPSSSSSSLHRKLNRLIDPSPGQLTLVVTCVVTQGTGGGGGGGSSGGGTSGTSISKNQMHDYLFFSDPRKKKLDGDNHGQQQPFYGAPVVLHFDLYPTVWLLSYLQRQVDCRCRFYADSTTPSMTIDFDEKKEKEKEEKEKEKEGEMSSNTIQRKMERGIFEGEATEGRQYVNYQDISNHRNDQESYDESRNVRCNDTHTTPCSTSSPPGQFFPDGRHSLSSSPNRVPVPPLIRDSCQIDRSLRLLLDLPLSLVPSPFPCCRGVVSWPRSHTLLPPVSMFPLSLQKKEKRHRRHPLMRGIMKRKEEREGLIGTRTGFGGGLRGCEARFPFAVFRVSMPPVESKSRITPSIDISSRDTTSRLQGELTRQEERRCEREDSSKKEVYRGKSEHTSSFLGIGNNAPRNPERSIEEERGQNDFSLESSSPPGGPPTFSSSSSLSSSSSRRLDGGPVSSSSSPSQSSLPDHREESTLLNVIAVACPDGYVILIDWKARAQQMRSLREPQKAKGVYTPCCQCDIPSLKETVTMKETSHQQQNENIPVENPRITPPIEEKDSPSIQVKRRELSVLQTIEDDKGIEAKNLPLASRDGDDGGVDALENGKIGRSLETAAGRKDDGTEVKEERHLTYGRMNTSQKDSQPINGITQATTGDTTDEIDIGSMMMRERENTSASSSPPSQDTLDTHSLLNKETLHEKRRTQAEAGEGGDEEGKELSLLSEGGELVVLGATMLGASAAMAKELKVRDDGEALLLRCTDRMVVARLIYPWTCSLPERKTFVKVYREQEREQRHAFLLQQQKQQVQLSHRLAAKNSSAGGAGGDSGRTGGGRGRSAGFWGGGGRFRRRRGGGRPRCNEEVEDEMDDDDDEDGKRGRKRKKDDDSESEEDGDGGGGEDEEECMEEEGGGVEEDEEEDKKKKSREESEKEGEGDDGRRNEADNGVKGGQQKEEETKERDEEGEHEGEANKAGNSDKVDGIHGKKSSEEEVAEDEDSKANKDTEMKEEGKGGDEVIEKAEEEENAAQSFQENGSLSSGVKRKRDDISGASFQGASNRLPNQEEGSGCSYSPMVEENRTGGSPPTALKEDTDGKEVMMPHEKQKEKEGKGKADNQNTSLEKESVEPHQADSPREQVASSRSPSVPPSLRSSSKERDDRRRNLEGEEEAEVEEEQESTSESSGSGSCSEEDEEEDEEGEVIVKDDGDVLILLQFIHMDCVQRETYTACALASGSSPHRHLSAFSVDRNGLASLYFVDMTSVIAVESKVLILEASKLSPFKQIHWISEVNMTSLAGATRGGDRRAREERRLRKEDGVDVIQGHPETTQVISRREILGVKKTDLTPTGLPTALVPSEARPHHSPLYTDNVLLARNAEKSPALSSSLSPSHSLNHLNRKHPEECQLAHVSPVFPSAPQRHVRKRSRKKEKLFRQRRWWAEPQADPQGSSSSLCYPYGLRGPGGGGVRDSSGGCLIALERKWGTLFFFYPKLKKVWWLLLPDFQRLDRNREEIETPDEFDKDSSKLPPWLRRKPSKELWLKMMSPLSNGGMIGTAKGGKKESSDEQTMKRRKLSCQDIHAKTVDSGDLVKNGDMHQTIDTEEQEGQQGKKEDKEYQGITGEREFPCRDQEDRHKTFAIKNSPIEHSRRSRGPGFSLCPPRASASFLPSLLMCEPTALLPPPSYPFYLLGTRSNGHRDGQYVSKPFPDRPDARLDIGRAIITAADAYEVARAAIVRSALEGPRVDDEISCPVTGSDLIRGSRQKVVQKAIELLKAADLAAEEAVATAVYWCDIEKGGHSPWAHPVAEELVQHVSSRTRVVAGEEEEKLRDPARFMFTHHGSGGAAETPPGLDEPDFWGRRCEWVASYSGGKPRGAQTGDNPGVPLKRKQFSQATDSKNGGGDRLSSGCGHLREMARYDLPRIYRDAIRKSRQTYCLVASQRDCAWENYALASSSCSNCFTV